MQVSNYLLLLLAITYDPVAAQRYCLIKLLNYQYSYYSLHVVHPMSLHVIKQIFPMLLFFFLYVV